jgi:hypothetical protein
MNEPKPPRRRSLPPAASDVSVIDEATGLWLGSMRAPARTLGDAPCPKLRVKSEARGES